MSKWPFPEIVIPSAVPAHTESAVHQLHDGVPCGHRGCLSHVSHPCEGCGRIAGNLTLRSSGADSEPQEIECEELSDLDVTIPEGDE